MGVSLVESVLKLWRFAWLYGPRRAVFKAAGRLRRPVPLVWRRCRSPDIAVIGCGQFAFATLGFFITRRFGRRLRWCFDSDSNAAESFARTLGVASTAEQADEAITDPETQFVYIASNHASHTEYALTALAAGKTVFVEKPVSVTRGQFAQLRASVRGHQGAIYAGYNRPFSGAVRQLKATLPGPRGALSLACFVSGHQIGADHWYREPHEGTRICGNAGHWIDLFVHVLAWRGLPDHYCIQLLSGAPANADDDFSLAIATDAGDIFSLMLTARTEPFEGINETINLQWEDVIAKIDDFRKMTIWQGKHLRRHRFWPKDVGHRAGALQPFANSAGTRDWREVEASTLIMLRVAEMVVAGERMADINLSQELEALDEKQEIA